MRLPQTMLSTRSVAKRKFVCGFTLVEVLAALLFMAILIPVTIEGVRVANRAGQVGERKAVAARIAERVLNELQVTGQLRQNSANGHIEERRRGYDWTMRSESWKEDRMTLVTVTVAYEVQGQKFDVSLSTLFDPNQTTTLQAQ